jgi:hypothetical protein
MLALQKELDNAHEDSQRAREREIRRSRQDEEELQILRERCERLEEERTSAVCFSYLSYTDCTSLVYRPTLKLLNSYAVTWRA